MTWAVRFEGVSKRYRIGGPRYSALRDDLAQLTRWILPVRRRRATSPDKVALDGVSFEVAQGEAFALVGPNGAGKTVAISLPDASRIGSPP